MEGYTAKITFASKELTPIEKIAIKDFTDAMPLDEVVTADEKLILKVESYYTVEIHNEHSESKDYSKHLIIDKDGNKYSTGSESLWTALLDIMEELNGYDGDWSLCVKKLESKNYKGKYFLTCSVI